MLQLSKISFISFSDTTGGANKAAYRIYSSLKSHNKGYFFCIKKQTKDLNVIQVEGISRFVCKLNRLSSKVIFLLLNKKEFRSLIIFNNPMGFLKMTSAKHVLNFHWFHFGFLKTTRILKLKKNPIILTLHDLNLVLGSRHYYDSKSYRSRFSRFIVNKRVKLINHREDIILVAPSNWMREELLKASIFSEKIRVIPYPINFEFWKNTNKENGEYILFGSAGGSQDRRKGFDIFIESIKYIKPPIKIAFFGGLSVADKEKLVGLNFIDFGKINSEDQLKKIYQNSRIVCIPSREDNLPLVAMEAIAMRKPIVAFNIGGMKDLVIDSENGYLADPFILKDYASKVELALDLKVSDSAYQKSFEKFNTDTISNRYYEIIRELNNSNYGQVRV